MGWSRRSFIATAALGAVAPALHANGQTARALRRVVLFFQGRPANPSVDLAAYLSELGWVNGLSVVVDQRSTPNADELPGIATDLVKAGVDVIVAGGTPAALAAKAATQTIPIVTAWVGDPVRSGLVASLARPGGNVTGPSWIGSTIAAKQLDILKEAVPRVSRVAIVRDATNRGHMTSDFSEIQRVARHLRVTLQFLDIDATTDVTAAVAKAARERIDAMIVYLLAVLSPEQIRIMAEAVRRHGIATSAGRRDYVDAGMLLSYNPNFRDELKRAAVYVDKILRGAKPADLPVEQPTTFDLVINLKTAKALNLIVPQSLRMRATEVIE